MSVKVECDECGAECPKSTSINWVDTCDGTARNVWWCKECFEEGKKQEEPVICECCKRDFTDEVDDRSSFDETGKVICMECFDEEEEEEDDDVECEECGKALDLCTEVFNTQDDFQFCVPDGYYCEACSKVIIEDRDIVENDLSRWVLIWKDSEEEEGTGSWVVRWKDSEHLENEE